MKIITITLLLIGCTCTYFSLASAYHIHAIGITPFFISSIWLGIVYSIVGFEIIEE